MSMFELAFGGMVVLMAFIAMLLPLIVIYDVLVNQKGMQPLEKVLWIGIVLVFHVFGLLAYYLLVHRQDTLLLDEFGVGEGQRIDDLERLQRLHDDGALTDDEFQREKERILGDQ